MKRTLISLLALLLLAGVMIVICLGMVWAIVVLRRRGRDQEEWLEWDEERREEEEEEGKSGIRSGEKDMEEYAEGKLNVEGLSLEMRSLFL